VLAVRAVVFGIVIAIAAPVTFALLLILGTKLVQRVVAIGTDHNSSIWISYMIIGGLLVLGGSFLMSKRYESDPA
jgi:hypothetical protein